MPYSFKNIYNNYKQKMNQLKVFYLFITILLSGMMASCDTGDGFDSGSSNLKTGQIEIKAYPDNNRIGFGATVQRITIDWGDGNVEQLSPTSDRPEYSHVYSNQNLQTIKVNTEGMTRFTDTSYSDNFQELRFGNCPELVRIWFDFHPLLTVLDVSKCPALATLNCDHNQLTSLDVSKCTALVYFSCEENKITSLNINSAALIRLKCYYNQLSASALNSLFNSLPTRKWEDQATVGCLGNPGSSACDITIALKKGWGVY